MGKPHPQSACFDTAIEPSSFFGRLRAIYASSVLKAQLVQLKRSCCYDMFTGKWMSCYDTRRIVGAKALPNGLPPSLFWESDIGKWIEAACYFLADESSSKTPHAEEFAHAIDKLIGEIEAFQQADGYLNVYFTVVDPAGRFQNFRDMHEMYNAGHLLEGAIAHYRWTGSRRFLDVMIKNVECFLNAFGPGETQRPGYPGHPEFELAILRLYSVTKDPRHLQFAEYLLTARGTSPESLGNQRLFMWEAEQREDSVYGCWMKTIDDLAYYQSHQPLHDQQAILGHSVRAIYLLTACADLGGAFLKDAKRLWTDAMCKKMYVTGGLGSEPAYEGFSELEYYLPSSTDDGGCYAETCASIGAMMLTERILSHELNGKYRHILELNLYNAVLGGGSLDGKGFSYANKLATSGDECALRSEWFEGDPPPISSLVGPQSPLTDWDILVCCCPPNLSRTLGALSGYIWSLEAQQDIIKLDVYVYSSAKRSITIPGQDSKAEIIMRSDMPLKGFASIEIVSVVDVKVALRLPVADWMENVAFSVPVQSSVPGYVELILDAANPKVEVSFAMSPRLVYPDPRTRQDTLSVMYGPLVFVAEDVDNHDLEQANSHFALVGLSESASFTVTADVIANIDILRLTTKDVYLLDDVAATGVTSVDTLWRSVDSHKPVRSWKRSPTPLTFTPWFARGNRGGKGHLRVPFRRVGKDAVL